VCDATHGLVSGVDPLEYITRLLLFTSSFYFWGQIRGREHRPKQKGFSYSSALVRTFRIPRLQDQVIAIVIVGFWHPICDELLLLTKRSDWVVMATQVGARKRQRSELFAVFRGRNQGSLIRPCLVVFMTRGLPRHSYSCCGVCLDRLAVQRNAKTHVLFVFSFRFFFSFTHVGEEYGCFEGKRQGLYIPTCPFPSWRKKA